MKKVLFLVLTCEQEPYRSMEDAIWQTWGRTVSNYNNARLLFLTETDGIPHIFGDRIKVNAKPGLWNTWSKFYKGLYTVLTAYKWDYLVRLNTSTWCNVDAVMKFLENADESVQCWPGQVTYEQVPWMQGNAFIMTRASVEAVVTYGSKYLTPDAGCFTDEGGTSLALQEAYNSWLNYVKTVGVAYAHQTDECAVTEEMLRRYMFVQVKNFRNGCECFRDTEPAKMKYAQRLWNSSGITAEEVVDNVNDNLDTQYSCLEKYLQRNDWAPSGWWHTQSDSFCSQKEFLSFIL